ncbi:hypothetical protein ACWD7Y_11785 [Streptomyces drozdowiczii]
MFNQSPEKKARLRQKVAEIQLNMAATQCGFAIKDGQLRVKSRSLSTLLEEAAGLAPSVPLEGARAEVLDGTNWGKHAGAAIADVALLGPFGLVGVGREIAVKVTAADGTELVSICKKKFTTQAHKFCSLLNNRPAA